MSRLTKIHEKILSNFNAYVSDTTNIELLAENIDLFEKIPARYLKRLYKTITVFDFAENNDALLIIAYSYIHYAYENKEHTNLKNSLISLDKAKECFQTIIDSFSSLHPSHLNEVHAEQQLKANFELHRIKLLKAEMRLFFIEKEEINNMPNSALLRKELTDIISEYTNFKKILNNGYRDRIHRAQLLINKNLLDSIETGLNKARVLLEQLPQQHTAKRTISETISESNSSEQKNTQETPKRKRIKRVLTNNNKPTPVSSTQLSQIDLDNGNPSEWNGLAALVAVVSTATPMETLEKEEVEEEEEIVSPSIPQSALPEYVEDSKIFLNTFQQWSMSYFTQHKDYSTLQQNEKSLEKIAHLLLLSAVKLKQESAVFKDAQSNPIIKVAVQLLLFISGTGAQSNSEAVEKQNLLANTYSPLLRPFIRSFLQVPPEKFIGHLRNQFTHETPTNISFRGLETQKIIEQLFKFFESVLTTDDYGRIKECCLNSLMQANARLVEQNTAEFQLTV